MKRLTSETHPLRIDSIDLPSGGRIGMTFCPGKTDPDARFGAWHRDLETDLTAIRDWGASLLVTLMENHELDLLEVPDLGERTRAHELDWKQLPIVDVSIPSAGFEAQWPEHGTDMLRRIAGGESIVLHCRGGLGRTGLVAARLLVELGYAPGAAIELVRDKRPGTIETKAQERYVLDLRRRKPASPR
jgi:ADP-ribosyl-[dinitrogen reductase] hydrolase